MRMRSLPPLILLSFLLLVSSMARADNASALINQELDKPVDLELNDVFPGAMRAIQDRTGVRIRAEPEVWDLLPWGEQTNISAKIQNQTLRQALGAITQKLGLTFTLGDDAVIIQPMPALKRLGRRSTVQELTILDRLATEPMPKVAGTGNVRASLTAIDMQLDALKEPFGIEDRLDGETRNKIVNFRRGATMMDALEEITKQTRATWYPFGKTVIVLPKADLVKEQLAKTLTMRYNGAEIGQVLEDLRKKAGVAFEIDSGAIQRIPSEFRTVRVFWDNVTVQQALESLKGFAGIDYQITDRGVTITNPTPAATGAGTAADPVIAMVPLENNVTIFLRESQVPPELRGYLQHRLKRSVEELRQMAIAEKFPLTQPTTKPSH
jgi:hypothetical protein